MKTVKKIIAIVVCGFIFAATGCSEDDKSQVLATKDRIAIDEINMEYLAIQIQMLAHDALELAIPQQLKADSASVLATINYLTSYDQVKIHPKIAPDTNDTVVIKLDNQLCKDNVYRTGNMRVIVTNPYSAFSSGAHWKCIVDTLYMNNPVSDLGNGYGVAGTINLDLSDVLSRIMVNFDPSVTANDYYTLRGIVEENLHYKTRYTGEYQRTARISRNTYRYTQILNSVSGSTLAGNKITCLINMIQNAPIDDDTYFYVRYQAHDGIQFNKKYTGAFTYDASYNIFRVAGDEYTNPGTVLAGRVSLYPLTIDGVSNSTISYTRYGSLVTQKSF